ncbi:MAG: restriction endonuclease subunit S [Acidobacteria bacterium]|nr:restriction endonuclease subunit S [Acidobacteriota bacterium]MBI3427786.1 restriction endonuclease subunit S [Acidobacteriota bacterium]
MAYQAYADYSEIEPDWLGVLPRHWSFRRLRFAASEPLMYGANEAAVLDDRGLPRYIRITDVKDDGTLYDDTFRSLEEDVAAPYLLQDGDILLARSGATVGKSFQYLSSWGKAAYAGYLIRFRPDQCVIFPRFANYYFQTACYWACINSTLIQSTIENFSAEKYKELKLPLPGESEQQQIAAFLDWKTGQIDALIARKRELLEKLKEKRLAVITQAVTKGLNPATPLRDSGIPWLGQVPQHWEIVPLGFLMTMSGGMTPSMANSEYWDGDIPWVTPKDMKQPRISDSIDHITEAALRETAIPLIAVNAVLIVVRGMILAHSFPTAITERAVTINQDMKALRCGEQLNVEYLFWCLTGFAKVFSGLAQESAHGTRKMETETLKKFLIPVPPLLEQTAIVGHLIIQLQKLDRLMELAEVVINRLTEYRTALITAATTGKIDVRGVKIPKAP